MLWVNYMLQFARQQQRSDDYDNGGDGRKGL